MAVEKLCYNRGCGKTYTDDSPGECVFHVGAPIFHDAYKSWSCCGKKSTDFTEFLNIKGCTTGLHSQTKPDNGGSESKRPVAILATDQPQRQPFEAETAIAISVDPLSPMRTVPISLTPSMQKLVNDRSSDGQYSQPTLRSDTDTAHDVPEGEQCKNKGCSQAFSSSSVYGSESCIYHPGGPVFHEGMKYWSCCKKKTTDFTTFLAQAGCACGHHKWTGDHGTNGTSTERHCRYDHHQTGRELCLVVYAKDVDHGLSVVETNGARLHVELKFVDNPRLVFNLDLRLAGTVMPEGCKAILSPTKLEVVMAKSTGLHWSSLGSPFGESHPIDGDDRGQQSAASNDQSGEISLDDVSLIQPVHRLSSDATLNS